MTPSQSIMLEVRTAPIHTTPADGAMALHEAFEAREVDAMMAPWADDEVIVCVYRGCMRLSGYEAVRAGWERHRLVNGDAPRISGASTLASTGRRARANRIVGGA